ncbi:MAG: hypothetical protein IJQ23_03295, partial [Clostridia bacterium]|nr:hypothetical protein [Clostridia bacterium]
ALVGTTVQVSKVYVNEQGKNKYEIFDNVTITAEMIGDTSKIDFTPNGSSYPKIPLTIDGRTAKLSVHVIADMRGAKLLNSGVSETVYYSGGIPTSSYYLVKIYDNGYMVRYQIGSDGNVGPNVSSYQEYSTETYDGVTLYAIGTPTCYFVLEGNIVLGEMRYQKFVGYQHSEGQETTDYTFPITMMGMDMSFKVFNGEFAEMYTPSFISGGLVYSGTVKVVIENGILNFGGVEYIISENNILSLTLPEGEPFLTANIGGPEAWFYEDGAGFAVYGGQPIMAFTWIGNADLSVITFNMMGEDGSFYKWMIDGIYHYNEEPEWDAAWSIFELTYVKDGESKNYTLYKFEQSVYYLSDGDTVQNVDGGYQANIFEMDGDMGNASKYYYYNAEGEMHDAIRYHVEDETGTGFGYMYAVPAKGILVGYWQATGVNISSEEFTFTVNGDGNYVVSYNGKWLYTATHEMATNPSKDNKLIVTDYAVKQENDGEVIGEGAYKLNVYNVFNGEIMGPTELNVNSYKEFENKIYQTLSEHPDAPVFRGCFYDKNGREAVTSENFRSGDIYMLFEEKN